MSSKKESVMIIWHNFTSFTYGRSDKMSRIDKWDTLRSVFVHFIENVLLEWYPRLFQEERRLAPAFVKIPVISNLYLIFLAKP
jgi:hypothetical protein